MLNIRRSLAIALIFFVLSSLTCLPSLASESSSKLENSVVEFMLPNGMKWLLVKRGAAPVFSGIIYIKVGGVDEEIGKTGLAHMLEHMAFKGTKDIPGEELWDAFVRNGASDLNASTSKDVTEYHASMPASKLELWLYLNSEMIKHSEMKDFFKERDVITEELLTSSENNPGGKMFRSLLDTAFDVSPYKWPTIGRKEDVVKLQPEFLVAFKKKYYIPSRMVGALTGNIDIEQAKSLITKYFGGLPAAKKVAENFPKEKPQEGVRKAAVTFDASQSIIIGYHKKTLPDQDDYVFDVLTYILCQGENSRLNSELVYKKKLVRSIGCDSSTPGARLDDLFIIGADPMSGKSYDDVSAAIEAELEKLRSAPPTEAELTTARNNVAKDFIFSLADNQGIAHSLAYFQTLAGDWRYMTRHANVVSKITGEDVMNVAKKYFTEDNKTVITLVK